MLIRGRCPHCNGAIFIGTLTKTIRKDTPKAVLDKQREASPEVDKGEGEESPDDLTKPWKKDDFTKNRGE